MYRMYLYYSRIIQLLKILFLKCLYFKKCNIDYSLRFRSNFNIIIEEQGNLKIGRNCFFNHACSISCLGNIRIGENCLFGENVKLYDHNHKYTDRIQLIVNQGFSIGKITIGNNCWIGSNVTILKNVVIGDNVVIGANCLIYHSIPNNTVVKVKQEKCKLEIGQVRHNIPKGLRELNENDM